MQRDVPPLEPKPPGLGVRALGLMVPGIRQISGQIAPYTAWWSEQNQAAIQAEGPLLVVIGDSTAIGIGASSPGNSYAALVGRSLSERDGEGWRIINLAQSGARVADALDRQLPIAGRLPTAEATICCVGTNDVVWSSDIGALRDRLRRLIAALPPAAVVAGVAGGSPRARSANRAVRAAAAEQGLPVVDPWGEPGAPPGDRLAVDRFHPNDLGYELMARPFARALDTPEPRPTEPTP